MMGEKKFRVKMGELIVAQEDVIFENENNQKTTMKKGEKSIVGFDGNIHRLKQRTIIIPDESFDINGYSATGLAEFIVAWLDRGMDLNNILKKSEYSIDDIKECVEMALIEIGMEDTDIDEENEYKEKE